MQPSTEKPTQKKETLQMVWDTPTNEFAPPEHSIIREWKEWFGQEGTLKIL